MMQTTPDLTIDVENGVARIETDDETITFEIESKFGATEVTESACTELFNGHYWDRTGKTFGVITQQMGKPSRHCKLCGRHEIQRSEWRGVNADL